MRQFAYQPARTCFMGPQRTFVWFGCAWVRTRSKCRDDQLCWAGQIPWFLSYRCFDSLHQHPILTPTYTRLTIPTYFSPSTSQLLVHSQLVGTNSQLASVGQIPWFLSYRCFDSLHQHPILTPTYTRLTIPTYFSPSTSQLLVHPQLVCTNSQLASVGQIPWFLSYRCFDIFLSVSICWLGPSPWMHRANWSIDRHCDSNAT